MVDKDILKILDFMNEIEEFKTIKRHCYKSNLESETNSDHTWHLCMLILLLKEKLLEKNLNLDKCLKIALLHDLPEIYAGDLLPFKTDLNKKKQLEKEGAKKLFEKLPNNLSLEFNSLFFEYLNLSSAEGKFVKTLDKFMPMIVNLKTNNSHSSYKFQKVTKDECYNYINKFVEDDFLKDLFDYLFKKMVEKDLFYKN